MTVISLLLCFVLMGDKELNPVFNDEGLWVNDGKLLSALGDELVARSGKDSRDRARAGVLMLLAGNTAAAEEHFAQARDLDKNDDDTWFIIARGYALAGMGAKADKAFEETAAMAELQEDDGTLMNIAWMYAEKKQWGKVDHYMQMAIQADPNDYDNYVEFAATYMMRGDKARAREWLKKALASKPKEERLYWKAGMVMSGSFKSFYDK